MTPKEAVLKLLEQTQHPWANAGLSLLTQYPHSFASGLEERAYIYGLYRSRLERAKEIGAFYEGLPELVENLARLAAHEVRLSTFTLKSSIDFAVLTDPFIKEIIGYL
jgi:hypothetical protein